MSEVDKFLAVADGHPRRIVIGSLAIGGAEVHQTQSRLPQAAGRLGNRIIQLAVLPGIGDSQRGCKLLSAEACDAILGHCRIDGWGFDVELLAVAQTLGYEVVELPVRWVHRDGSKVGALACLSVLIDVIRTRATIRTLRRAGSRDDLPVTQPSGAAAIDGGGEQPIS